MKMKQTKIRNLYLGKEVFVGIDVHKKTYAVVARVEREVVKRWTTAASPQGLAEQLLKYFEGGRIQTVYKIEQKIKEQALEDANESTYRSSPGIGILSSRILSNELGNMSQFKNERELFSYTGLTPCEYSSGENIRRGKISKQGNSRLRHVLVEAAWRAIKKDKALGDFFERLYPRTGKKRAIVAVARKLIGRIRAAFRQGVSYQLGYQVPQANVRASTA